MSAMKKEELKKKVSTKKTTVKKVTAKKEAPVKKVSSDKPVEAKHVYIFFNCNEGKETTSMNILHNHEVFGNASSGRKALWVKVQEEVKAGRVHLYDEDVVKTAIIKGNPQDATEHMQYGYIAEMEYFV